MSKDEQLKEQVMLIKVLASTWLNTVKEYGNQCAYTDRGIEEIIAAGAKLEEIYNG